MWYVGNYMNFNLSELKVTLESILISIMGFDFL